jgi:hypothetical protein
MAGTKTSSLTRLDGQRGAIAPLCCGLLFILRLPGRTARKEDEKTDKTGKMGRISDFRA